MTWGTIQIGRMTLRETYLASQDGDGTLTLTGEESAPPLTLAALVLRHDNIIALRDQIVPVVFTDKSNLDGFYRVDTVSSTLVNYGGNGIATSQWSLTMTRLGREHEIEIESRLHGSGRQNDHSITAERWHGVPDGAYAYFTGATAPSTVTREYDNTTSGGSGGDTVAVFRVVPDVDPRWGIAPASYYLNAARIDIGATTIQGLIADHSPADWTLANDMVKVEPNATNPGRLDIAVYEDAAWSSKTYTVEVDSVAIDTAWDTLSVLRNDPEEVIVRLTRAVSPAGKITLDLTLKRGARFVAGYLQRHASATLKVVRSTAEAGTSGTGFVRATSNDADGNRYVIGSARTFTADTASGGISKAATTTLDFFVGAEVDGSTAVAGDQAANLAAQYIGTPAETTMVVTR